MCGAAWLQNGVRIGHRPLMLALLFVLLLLGVPGIKGPNSASTARSHGGFVATVDVTGRYRVTFSGLGWTFEGSVGAPVTSLTTSTGKDQLGAYQAIVFGYDADGPRLSSIRAYAARPLVLFSTTYLSNAPNIRPFPALSKYPHLPFRLGFDGEFVGYSFQRSGQGSPWFFFDQRRQGFALSPASNFMVASTQQQRDGSFASGITSAIPRLPAGFTQWTMLVGGDGGGDGINSLIETWGGALTGLYGKVRRPNDADVTLNTLGYWTDNGAAYYYRHPAELSYAETLLAVKDYLSGLGIQLGYMQLDSWWYPKGANATWQGSGYQRGGIYAYQAAPALFPDGLAVFQRQLSLPLMTHARWIDQSSPYRQEYATSGNVVVDPRYWSSVMAYLKSAGVVSYEQDWLAGPAVARENLTDPRAFLTNMASAGAHDGLTLQYCGATPREYLQSVEYGNVTTMRVNPDRFGRNRWDQFLYGSRLAAAVDTWPWSDVFKSAETPNLLLATLSAGIVGIGDAIGTSDVTNLLQAARPDGVLVKPDAPIMPIDESYIQQAQNKDAPMVASTYTRHGDQLARYVFAYARTSGDATAPISFRPADLGITGPSYVYEYFAKTGVVLPPGGTFSQSVPNSGTYYIVVPIGRSGIAFLGDAGKFVSLGKKRISALSDDGVVRATVSFAPGERAVTLHGYATALPAVTATGATVAAASYDPATHLFEVTLAPGTGGSAQHAQIELRPAPGF
jgi:hypothetical protein